MAKQLLVIAGPDRGRCFPLTVAGLWNIGISHNHSEICLHDLAVSRVHCEVAVEDDRIVLTDMDSVSGTFVNNQRISRQELKCGDVIRIGGTELCLGDDDEEPAPAAASSTKQPKPAMTLRERLSELAGQHLGHYEVGPVLAKGHSGLVFRAQDLKQDRPVALKVLQPAFPKNDEEMQRFVRAMKTALALHHPNLAALHGVGKSGPYCWLAYEYVDGKSLTQVIQRLTTAAKRDWRVICRIAHQLAQALAFIHQHQIIHGNLTPQNVMVRRGDHLTKIGDLMLAEALEGSAIKQVMLRTKLQAELNYLAPEQTHRSEPIESRTDLHAVGAMTYTMLTGRPPFEGQSQAETVTKLRRELPLEPVRFLPDLPEQFQAIVLKLLAKRPDERYQTAAELAGDLERLARQHGFEVMKQPG
jgi:serine/threonine protein kinase